MLNNTLILTGATIIYIEICLLISLVIANLIIWIKKKKQKKNNVGN